LEQLIELIREYGTWFYAIAFAWSFLEGETFVIFAGAIAAKDNAPIHLTWLILTVGLGSFCGDQFYFFIGRRYGKYLLRKFPRWQGRVDKALGMLYKYHVGFILSFRFVYGVRNIASFAMGMSEVPWPRFFALNFIAAAVWAITFAGAGFLLGRTLEHLLGEIARDFGLIMLGLLLAVVTIALTVSKRRQKRAAAAAEAQAAAAAEAPPPVQSAAPKPGLERRAS
jgi:membrane protein DedA with SNARE-associated domain